MLVPPLAPLTYMVCRMGQRVSLRLIGQDLTVLRADGLSLVFGNIFSFVGVIASIYTWHHINDRKQQVFALLYNAGALVAFAGDLHALRVLGAVGDQLGDLDLVAQARRLAASGQPFRAPGGGSVPVAPRVQMYRENTGTLAFERFLGGGSRPPG